MFSEEIWYNLRLGALSRNVLSSKNHDAKGVKNPYENRERTQCLMNTRSFIFFTRILARVQNSSLDLEGCYFVFWFMFNPQDTKAVKSTKQK